MTGRQLRQATLPGIVALTLAVTGCGDSNPTGVPYRDLGRDLAGIYYASVPEANLNMRLVLGTRHTVTGRYDSPNGLVRFQGTWERDEEVLLVSLPAQEGLPSDVTFSISREEILTEIPRSPFSQTPETDPPEFIRQNIMRLRAAALVAGAQLDLNLIRVITDVTGGSGGPTRA